MTLRIPAFIAIAFVAAGCQSVPIASTPRTIIFNGVSDLTIQDATLKAQVHCSQFDRDAELVPDDVPDGRATFRCTDKMVQPT